MDPTAIHTTSNGQHLFSHGTDNFCNISGYGHFTPNENDGHLYPSNYSDPHAGCFTCLILLSRTTTLQATSYHFHLAQEKIEA